MAGHRADPLADLTSVCFNAYNHAGPSERAGLTHDGKRVPPLDRCGAIVRHKWGVATANAARMGAIDALRLVKEGGTPEDVERLILVRFADPRWAGDGGEGGAPGELPPVLGGEEPPGPGTAGRSAPRDTLYIDPVRPNDLGPAGPGKVPA